MTLPKFMTATSLTPWQKRWLKRLLVFLVVSFVFAGTPILLVSVESYLLGRWGVLGKIGRRVYSVKNVRVKYRRRAPRPDPQ